MGDALATVAGDDEDHPLKEGVDPEEFEFTLTDLAGVLALATHGTGRRAHPDQWTEDFVAATTTPAQLSGGAFENNDRRGQNAANRSNLLLLLSRGYWSTDFLKAVTKRYYVFDRKESDNAWPKLDEDAKGPSSGT